jgi:hypothetical protein
LRPLQSDTTISTSLVSLAVILINVVGTYLRVSASIFADLSGPSGCHQERNFARRSNFGRSGG